jgi:hypothetical protein
MAVTYQSVGRASTEDPTLEMDMVPPANVTGWTVTFRLWTTDQILLLTYTTNDAVGVLDPVAGRFQVSFLMSALVAALTALGRGLPGMYVHTWDRTDFGVGTRLAEGPFTIRA